MMKTTRSNTRRLVPRITKRRVLVAVSVLIVAIVAVQVAYPSHRMALFQTIDGVEVGGLTKKDAAEKVAGAYSTEPIEIYFGSQTTAYATPQLQEIGGSIRAEEVESISYTWWQRLIPSSLFWAHALNGDEPIAVQYNHEAAEAYVQDELGESCSVEPRNASVVARDGTLEVQSAENGGTCELSEVLSTIEAYQPSLTNHPDLKVAIEEIPPEIDDEAAEKVISQVMERLPGDKVTVSYDKKTATIPTKTVLSWLEFPEEDGALQPTVSAKKANDALTEQFGEVVARKAGTVTITTRDFAEIKREGGGNGRALDVSKTAANLTQFIRGEADNISIGTKTIKPTEKYIRTYSDSDTGLSALMKNFAQDNDGVYGVSLRELSGERRNAGYNANKQFTTASTYKLYVAISTLRRVENGSMKWSDSINGGRNLEKCFDDMIVLSDNPCAEALVQKIGYSALHKEAAEIGATNTNFLDTESYKTTAGDLTIVMAQLQAKQLPLSDSLQNKLLSVLKRNVYRQGIPAGANGTVADKVGFLDNLLHDTAIVSGSNGTYALSIMTEDSSWANIAKLTAELEKLRAR